MKCDMLTVNRHVNSFIISPLLCLSDLPQNALCLILFLLHSPALMRGAVSHTLNVSHSCVFSGGGGHGAGERHVRYPGREGAGTETLRYLPSGPPGAVRACKSPHM